MSGAWDLDVLEVDDGRWDDHAGGAGRDPYCLRGFLAATSEVQGNRPVLVVAGGDGWSATYVVVLTPLGGDRWLARTPDYGGPRLDPTGTPASVAATDLRRCLDEFSMTEGVVSEVALLSPWLPHRDAVATAWGAVPEKMVWIARLDDLGTRWRSLSKGRRTDITSTRRDMAIRWAPFDHGAAVSFASAYAAAMSERDAPERWVLGEDYFVSLATTADAELWLATAECDAGGAAALFLLGEDRAAYLYAARWGRSRGSASAVVWRAQEELSARSFSELLLGGGLTTADDDPLLRFKASLADIAAPLLLAGRAFDSAAHARAVEVGRARPLPNGSAAPH